MFMCKCVCVCVHMRVASLFEGTLTRCYVNPLRNVYAMPSNRLPAHRFSFPCCMPCPALLQHRRAECFLLPTLKSLLLLPPAHLLCESMIELLRHVSLSCSRIYRHANGLTYGHTDIRTHGEKVKLLLQVCGTQFSSDLRI